jgi:hypothetical protein
MLSFFKTLRQSPVIEFLLDGKGDRFRWQNRIVLALCAVFGGVMWGKFLNWGNIPFDFHDWAEVNAARFEFLRQSVLQGVLPLHMSGAGFLRGVTDRFMSVPDVFLSPQLFLLRFLEIGPFILVNTLLLYSISVWGLWWLKKHFSLSPLVFIFMFLLFNFNGHILAHMSVGHITWGGYFLFIWFLILVVKLLEGDHSWRWIIGMALLLFVTLLQGSFHQFMLESWFLALLFLVARKHWRPLLLSVIFAALFSMVRVLPISLTFGKFDTQFLGGYPSIINMFQSLVFNTSPKLALPFRIFDSPLGYWEFDLYVGKVGFLFILSGVVLWIWSQTKDRKISPLLLPMAVLTLLSISDLYLPLSKLPIPIFNSGRVTSRFFILPMIFVFVLSAKSIQNVLNNFRYKIIALVVLLGAVVYQIIDVIQQVSAWQVTESFQVFPLTPVDLSRVTIGNHADPVYFQMILIGFCISAASLMVATFLVLRERRDLKRSQNALDVNEN